MTERFQQTTEDVDNTEIAEQETDDDQSYPRVEKDDDGEAYLVYEEEQDDPDSEASDEEGKAEQDSQTEGNQDAEGESNTQTDEEDSSDTDFDVPEEFEGKSREEVIEDYVNLKTAYDRQGTEVGELRKKAKVNEMSEDELRQEMSSDELKVALKTAQNELSQLQDAEDTDDETLQGQKDTIADIKADLEEKIIDEKVEARLNSEENKEFTRAKKEEFADRGIELDDEEFQAVAETAKQYQVNGKLTDESFYKALIDNHGAQKVAAWMSVEAAEEERDKMAQSRQKETKTVDVNSKGKKQIRKPLGNMTEREIAEMADQMPLEEVKRLRKELDEQLL